MIDLAIGINVAGAALFALVGVGILLIARTSRQGFLVGAAAVTFGMTWVFQNFLGTSHRSAAEVGVIVFSSLGAVAAVALVHHLIHGSSRNARRGIAALGAALVLAWVALHVILLAHDVFGSIVDWAQWGAYFAFLFALVLLMGAIAAAFREGGPAPRALASLGLAYGPFVTFLFVGFGASAGFSAVAFGSGLDLLMLGLGSLVVAATLPFARGRASTDPLSRKVFPTLLASGFAGLLLVLASGPTYEQDFGSFGIVRTLGAFFLALAVLKFDLLGVPLPRFAARRGTLATGTLAALFIVAQIAQEFFAAEYGLLLGGVVAGTLLFAAHPIQRAMERLAGHETDPARAPEAPAPAGPPPAVAEREDVYREAVRLALRDRVLTREEERHLLRLAYHLGVPTPRAIEIHDELVRETSGGGA